jgi:hypothetical protein
MTTSNAATATSTYTGKKVGAKVNPNSGASRAYAILKALPADQRKRATALVRFKSELGLESQVASVYFYNSLKRINAEEEVATPTV